MEDGNLKALRREERRRNRRKMHISGRMTAILNAIRKAAPRPPPSGQKNSR